MPETPPPKGGPSLRFATSTPFTGRSAGMNTTIQEDIDSALNTPEATPKETRFTFKTREEREHTDFKTREEQEHTGSKNRGEIKLPDKEKGIVLDTKKLNVECDGSKVELFIKHVEKIAALQKAGGRDVARQLPFMIKDKKISEAIENMEGQKNPDWELLKKELTRKWGRATPRRRFNENSVSELIIRYADKGGIQTKKHQENKWVTCMQVPHCIQLVSSQQYVPLSAQCMSYPGFYLNYVISRLLSSIM
jgi:hypothetical protein